MLIPVMFSDTSTNEDNSFWGNISYAEILVRPNAIFGPIKTQRSCIILARTFKIEIMHTIYYYCFFLLLMANFSVNLLHLDKILI